jgi:hypothetical protein
MPTPIPPKQQDFESEPVTYHQLQRRRDGLPEAGEPEPGDIPKLPPESPWAADVVGKEPSIDRSEDAANGGLPDMTEVQQ